MLYHAYKETIFHIIRIQTLGGIQHGKTKIGVATFVGGSCHISWPQKLKVSTSPDFTVLSNDSAS